MARDTRVDRETYPVRRRERELFPLNDLPVNVLAIALSKTNPRDVCRLTAVNKTFAEAASSDLVWKAFLPADIEEILQIVQGGAPSYRRLKDLYNHLTNNHLLLGDGTTGYFLERDTGGVCRTVSARTLCVAHGDNLTYWDWLPCEGSRFREVAYLKFVCWLELWGEMKYRLPPGVYTLSWMIKFHRRQSQGWNEPITFTATDGTKICQKIFRSVVSSPRRPVFARPARPRGNRGHGGGRGSIFEQWLERQGSDRDEWWECNVGDFTVTKADDADSLGVPEMHLSFAMKEITRLHGVRGLYVDGLILRPKLAEH